jgi:hypothetical protein
MSPITMYMSPKYCFQLTSCWDNLQEFFRFFSSLIMKHQVVLLTFNDTKRLTLVIEVELVDHGVFPGFSATVQENEYVVEIQWFCTRTQRLPDKVRGGEKAETYKLWGTLNNLFIKRRRSAEFGFVLMRLTSVSALYRPGLTNDVLHHMSSCLISWWDMTKHARMSHPAYQRSEENHWLDWQMNDAYV